MTIPALKIAVCIWICMYVKMCTNRFRLLLNQNMLITVTINNVIHRNPLRIQDKGVI